MAKRKVQNCLVKIKKYFLPSIFGLIGLFFIPSFVSAQTYFSYPILELGYCRDAKECYLYCQIPENKATCWSYGKYVLGERILGEQEPDDVSTEEKAKALGIVFPIAELGNCASVRQCRDYCADPVNHGACTSFARKHGLHKRREQKKEELLKAAAEELGCTAKETCRAFCDRPENRERCREFATKHGLHRAAGQGIDKKELLKKARLELKCDSIESCRQFCDEHPQECQQFAKKHGFHRAAREIPKLKEIPGKCSTVNECVEYCRENQEECRRYLRERRLKWEKEADFPGPGGCESEESCRIYCQKHPDECPGFKRQPRHLENQQTNESTEGYVGPSGCRTEAECRAFCQKHPNKCPGFIEGEAKEIREFPTKFYPAEGFQPSTEPLDSQKFSTDQDRQYSINDLIEKCKNSGCIWEENTCRCN